MEQRRYSEIAPRVPWETSTTLVKHEFSRRYGLIAYGLTGARFDDLIPLAERCAVDPPSSVKPLIDWLFHGNLSHWFGDLAQPAPNRSLDDWYRERLDLDELPHEALHGRISAIITGLAAL